jgi:hypothetical protein
MLAESVNHGAHAPELERSSPQQSKSMVYSSKSPGIGHIPESSLIHWWASIAFEVEERTSGKIGVAIDFDSCPIRSILALHELDASPGDISEFFLEPPLFLWRRVLHERMTCGGEVIEGTKVFVNDGRDNRCTWRSIRACVLEGVASGRC